MQWDDSANAGFTIGTPWIRTTGNYKTINAKACLADKDSVFYYYQKLIRLRHELPEPESLWETHQLISSGMRTRLLCQMMKTALLLY